MKDLPTTLNEATELLQRMINKPACTQEIRELFKGCLIQYDHQVPVGSEHVIFSGDPLLHRVTALPLEQVSVITEQPKRVMQDDWADGYKAYTDLSELTKYLQFRQSEIRVLSDNTLVIRNGESDTVGFNADYYRPMLIADKQQEILAIVARMRDLLTDISKSNGGF